MLWKQVKILYGLAAVRDEFSVGRLLMKSRLCHWETGKAAESNEAQVRRRAS